MKRNLDKFFEENKVKALPCSHDAIHNRFQTFSHLIIKTLTENKDNPGNLLTIHRLYEDDRYYRVLENEHGEPEGIQFIQSGLKLIWS